MPEQDFGYLSEQYTVIGIILPYLAEYCLLKCKKCNIFAAKMVYSAYLMHLA